MPHLAGRCHCGRTIHYPAGSSSGARWTCRRCGLTWVIARPGEGGRPLETRGSKAPRPRRSSPRRRFPRGPKARIDYATYLLLLGLGVLVVGWATGWFAVRP